MSAQQHHQGRLEEHQRQRDRFFRETASINRYIASDDSDIPTVQTVVRLSSQGYEVMERTMLRTPATQSNIIGLSELREAKVSNKKSKARGAKLLARVINIKRHDFAGSNRSQTSTDSNDSHGSLDTLRSVTPLTNSFKRQLLEESLKILRYLSAYASLHPTRPPEYLLLVHDVFHAVDDQRVVVLHDAFPLDSSMYHKLIRCTGVAEEKAYSTGDVKHWTIQLAKAVSFLHSAGVVHRFIRPENILHKQDGTIQLTAFDFAVRFWSAQTRRYVKIKPAPVSANLPAKLLDHLPPECFTLTRQTSYDGAALDIWSVGVFACIMLTRTSPFQPTPQLPANSKQTGNPKKEKSHDQEVLDRMLTAWRGSDERRLVPDEMRSLLDDVFQAADERMTPWELAEDPRFNMRARDFFNSRLKQYYRIDLIKKINRKKAPSSQAPSSTPPSNQSVRDGQYHPRASQLLSGPTPVHTLTGSERTITNYRVDRENSFSGGLQSPHIINEQFLLASRRAGNGHEPCLVRIINAQVLPMRYNRVLQNESLKIMGYFSKVAPEDFPSLHKILDVFYLNEAYIYIFYEPLEPDCLTLYCLINRQKDFPPTENANKKPSHRGEDPASPSFTLGAINKWMLTLSKTLNAVAQYAFTHRYVRPEYVFVTKSGSVKLTHHDMACCIWNAREKCLAPRSRALQDECQHAWDHLPPECYDTTYDATGVDAWSLGTLLLLCVTGENPFDSPMNMEEAAGFWREFKRATKMPTAYTNLLNRIFVERRRRLAMAKIMQTLEGIVRAPPPPPQPANRGGTTRERTSSNKRARSPSPDPSTRTKKAPKDKKKNKYDKDKKDEDEDEDE